MLIQITAPHFCAGIIVKHGVVTDAAPILRWCIGRTWESIRRWSFSQDYQFTVVK